MIKYYIFINLQLSSSYLPFRRPQILLFWAEEENWSLVIDSFWGICVCWRVAILNVLLWSDHLVSHPGLIWAWRCFCDEVGNYALLNRDDFTRRQVFLIYFIEGLIALASEIALKLSRFFMWKLHIFVFGHLNNYVLIQAVNKLFIYLSNGLAFGWIVIRKSSPFYTLGSRHRFLCSPDLRGI